jgi:predicted PurR-regulated permease PerM
MIKKVLIFYCIFFVFFGLIYSTFENGNDLVKNMREYEKMKRNEKFSELGIGMYTGFIGGIYDTWEGIEIFPSTTVKLEQILDVVTKFLNENPERWGEPAGRLVLDALKKAFPVKK